MRNENLSGGEFLDQTFNDLRNSPEVQAAAERSEQQTGERIQRPAAKIENFVDRLASLATYEQPAVEPTSGHPRGREANPERGLNALKHLLHKNYVIPLPEDTPERWESYWANQQRLAREQGHGDIEITAEMKGQLAEVVITDQESSLDNWLDYLASADATYPDWLKYYAVRGVLSLGAYDKQRQRFARRDADTVAPFCDLNREALAYVLDAIEKQATGAEIDLTAFDPADQQKLQQLLQGANFGKLYVWALEKVTPESQEVLANITGEWIKFPQGTDPTALVQSLQGHGTGWCTAGESTAQTQLTAGDFYVYYSQDAQGQSTVPRAAIRMEGAGEQAKIAEVRGIAEQQNLDSFIAPVVQTKLAEFPDGAFYEKKSQNMQQLTQIEQKTRRQQELTPDELKFLYEIDHKIEGFGYDRDPRITELRSQRDPLADAPIVFECTPEQIAHQPHEINEQTRAYVGPLFPGIFTQLSHNEDIYTDFPEGKIRRSEVEIGGKTEAELRAEIYAVDENGNRRIRTNEFSDDMLNKMFQSDEFKNYQRNPEQLRTIRLKVDVFDLGFHPKISQIIGTENDTDANGAPAPFTSGLMTKFGLSLCPAEIGPHQRLQDHDQSLDDLYEIAMKPFSDKYGVPDVFSLGRDGGGLWLRGRRVSRDIGEYNPAAELMFCLRKLET